MSQYLEIQDRQIQQTQDKTNNQIRPKVNFQEDIPLCQQSNAFYWRTDAPCRINLISEKNYHFLDPSKGWCYVSKIEPPQPLEISHTVAKQNLEKFPWPMMVKNTAD